MRGLLLLGLAAASPGVTSAFTSSPHHAPVVVGRQQRSQSRRSTAPASTTATTTTTTMMVGRSGAIETPEIPQDTKPRWYILNCATGNEMTCKKLLELKIDKFNLYSEVMEVVVPTQASSSTRGKKVYANHRTLYPSYVFMYMIMGPEVHSALTNTDHVINFVGRDHGVLNGGGSGLTGARGFVSPIPLTEREIDGFQLRTAEGAKLDDPTLGFTIGEFVEVTGGPHQGERGAVRLVRNGMIVVRLYAYGQRMDLEFEPAIVRAITVETMEEEVRPEMKPRAPMTFEEQEKADARQQQKAGRWEERQQRKLDRQQQRPGFDGGASPPSSSSSSSSSSPPSSSSSSSSSSPPSSSSSAAYMEWRRSKSSSSAPSPSLSSSMTSSSSSSSSSGESESSDDDDDDFLNQLSMLMDDVTDGDGSGGGQGERVRQQVESQVKQEQDAKALEQKEDAFLSALFDDFDDDESSSSSGAAAVAAVAAALPVGPGVLGDRGGAGQKELKDMTVAELKDACRELGLRVGGTKAVLQDRLREEANMT